MVCSDKILWRLRTRRPHATTSTTATAASAPTITLPPKPVLRGVPPRWPAPRLDLPVMEECSAGINPKTSVVHRVTTTVNSITPESTDTVWSRGNRSVPIDLTAEVSGVVDELRPMLRGRELRLAFRDEPLVALASTEELHRLLGYLLENASKYAPDGGAIDIYGWRDADCAYLAVTDDGPGIPAAWRERIFEPFVRLDDSPRGAGIGLFAARRLARSMDGELTVQAREPFGSQFVLRLKFVGAAR